MPGPKRSRRERTDEWASIKQWTLWPEQELYEQIRPILLFGETAGERAKEIDAAQRTLSRKADEFEHYGMQSLFSKHLPREYAPRLRRRRRQELELVEDARSHGWQREVERHQCTIRRVEQLLADLDEPVDGPE